MKTVVFANQKGGVGKSAILDQLAYYFVLQRQLRVVVIDFDHQKNTTKALTTGGLCTVSPVTSSQILSAGKSAIGRADFVLVPGDGELYKMEETAAELTAFVKYAKEQGKTGARDGRSEYATNLLSALTEIAPHFDICLIDTNPNPDIRQLASLVVADYVVSPIQLNQEAIDGIGDLLNHPKLGIRKIKATINKKLTLIGILPNMVEPTPFQRDNFTALATHYPQLLISMSPLPGFAAVKKTTAIPEAQAVGQPVWKLGKTSARDAWTQMRPVFDKIAEAMEVPKND
ncbi:chromosome partitioning protein [Xanthomonas perforans]|jgi:chromosome partitioning protein|uniref:Chromosome partitioning protein n=8 Tax=Xanthomonas TaxID=338 RepID=A0A0G8W2D6_XANPE|nr:MULTISPECIES: ParA family protein [Xanthomonas]MBV6783157.1 ParA family protein [Xanthomonas campestris pv. trichodesmae]MEB1187369.1 ParA family protein [Xanthomonas campestris pv. campestris]OHX24289.1 chromosome partitioning protein [Xanthomonas alfalfae]AGH79863.1 cobyrinic acid ac-diamide synthase [Xanthomonas axonopodis Xac29-1]APP02082.1 chromosome partitioning protein [Xanthomonas perforans]